MVLWCYTYAVNCGYYTRTRTRTRTRIIGEVLVLALVLEATVLEISLLITTSDHIGLHGT